MTDLTRSAMLAARLVVIPVQPSPYDVWACTEVVDILKEASVFAEKMKSVFVINRKISNTAIGRDVADALATYELPVLRQRLRNGLLLRKLQPVAAQYWKRSRRV